jgi:hypothetical protein
VRGRGPHAATPPLSARSRALVVDHEMLVAQPKQERRPSAAGLLQVLSCRSVAIRVVFGQEEKPGEPAGRRSIVVL